MCRTANPAAALAILLREICEDIEVYTFNTTAKQVPARRGFALRDAIGHAGGGTTLGNALQQVKYGLGSERLIVITDEQSADTVGSPKANNNYMLNVASYQNGVGYGDWNRVDGWSEAVVNYIVQMEKE